MILDAILSTVLLQSVPPGIERAIDQILREATPTRVALYGGSGILSIGVIRWLVKRRASASSTATTGSLSKHKVAFTLPSVLPLSKGIRSVTHNEIHAIELGIVVGLVTAWLFSRGRTNSVVTILVAFVSGSLGFQRYGTKAFKTIRLEPWYALLALSGGSTLGWALFLLEPGLATRLGI